MIDTISISLDQVDAPNVEFLEEIPCLIDPKTITHYNSKGIDKVRGNIENFFVTVTKYGVFITGSLCKYWKGNNCETMTFTDTKEAITSLSERMNLPLIKGQLTRLDVGTNLQVANPPNIYYDSFGNAPYCQRVPQQNGVYYQTERRTIAIYDKLMECKDKKTELPHTFTDCQNLLRIEVRFKKALARQLDMKRISVEQLFDPSFNLYLLNRWYNEYTSIVKFRQILPQPIIYNSVKDYKEYLMLMGLEALGGMKNIYSQINTIGTAKLFENPMQKHRLIGQLNSICTNSILTATSVPIAEIDDKVQQFYHQFRTSIQQFITT